MKKRCSIGAPFFAYYYRFTTLKKTIDYQFYQDLSRDLSFGILP